MDHTDHDKMDTDIPDTAMYEEGPANSECSAWQNRGLEICEREMGRDRCQHYVDKAKKPSGSTSFGKTRMSMQASSLKSALSQPSSLFHQHNAVAASGYAVFRDDPRLPRSEFFVPGRRHRVRLRHGSLGCEDDAGSCPRGASLKFADQHDGGPLDLVMSTGRWALARNMNTLQDVIILNKLKLKTACKKDPCLHYALVDSCRRAPESYTSLQYHTQLPFCLTDRNAVSHIVRFRLVPHEELTETGQLDANDQEEPWNIGRTPKESRANDYLRREFKERLSSEPIRYSLQIQLHNGSFEKDADLWNAQAEWKESRCPWLPLADITITTLMPPTVAGRTTFNIDNRPPCLKIDSPTSAKDFRSLHVAYSKVHNLIEDKKLTVAHAGPEVQRTERWHVTLSTELLLEDDTKPNVDVYIILTGTEGRCTACKLVHDDQDDDNDQVSDDEVFKRPSQRICEQQAYCIHTEPVGQLLTVTVHVKHRTVTGHWFLRYVTVADASRARILRFPCYRVVIDRIVLLPGEVALPESEQAEVLKQERLLDINERRRQYRWHQVDGLPNRLAASDLSDLPDTEQYAAERFQNIRWHLEPTWNDDDVLKDRFARPRSRRSSSTEMIGQALNPNFAFYKYGYRTLINYRMRAAVRQEDFKRQSKRMSSDMDASERRAAARSRWKKLRTFAKFAFGGTRRKGCAHSRLNHICRAAEDDEEFGNWFQMGPHPYALRRISEIPRNFPVDEDQVKRYLERNMTLSEEATAGNVYLLDYKLLDGIQCYNNKGDVRFVTAPMCLLYMDKRDELMPIAIQLHQQPAEDNPVYTPSDNPEDWLMAKLWLRCADFQVYHFVEHLLRCHVIVESFAVATMRQLSVRHPVYKLLRPHFRFLLVSNVLMRVHLLNKGGAADRVSAIGGGGHVELMKRAYREFNFDSLDIHKDVQARGVASQRRPKFYPYRDDGIKVSDALLRCTSQILRLYYEDDDAVKNDKEIQNWYNDVIKNGLKLEDPPSRGMPKEVHSLEALEGVIIKILFTCTCAHSAVDNEAIDIYGYFPDVPAAMFKAPPTRKGKTDIEEILATLPVQNLIGYQTATAYLLKDCPGVKASLKEGTECHFTDPDALHIITAYEKQLSEISDQVRERSKADPQAGYQRLLPDLIPASIDPLPNTRVLLDNPEAPLTMQGPDGPHPGLVGRQNSAPLFMPLMMGPDKLFRRRMSYNMFRRSLSAEEQRVVHDPMFIHSINEY